MAGCAYYNTFYHAKKYYKQAEKAEQVAIATGKPARQASDLYKQSIDKCKKVIEDYPDSKWQDDAHLLMAKAYYGRGDYLSAERTLKKFPQRFSDSDLYDEAMYWRGLTAYAQAEYPEARLIWEELLARIPDLKEREEVEFYLAQAKWYEGRDEAADAFRAFLEKYPRGDHAASARLDLGGLLMDQGKYAEAEEVFTEVADHGKEEADRLDAQLYLGEALEAQDRHEEALELYVETALALDPDVFKYRMSNQERAALRESQAAAAEAAHQDSIRLAQELAASDSTGGAAVPPPQQGVDPFAPNPTTAAQAQNQRRTSVRRNLADPRDQKIAQVMLREGSATAKLGRPFEAIEIFEQVIFEFPRSPYAAEAQYRIGYMYEVQLEDFGQAQVAYNEVPKQGASSFREDAARRAKNLNTVKSLLAQSASDSLSQAASAAAEARFMRAELYLFQQENPEKALGEYRGIESEFSGTDHAAKAGLAVAWVTGHSLGDSLMALEKYKEVADAYPNTEFGRRAARVLYGPEKEPEPEEFVGPSVDELTSPENLAVIALMRAEADSAKALEEASIASGAKTGPVVQPTPEYKPVTTPIPEGSSLADAVKATTPATVTQSPPGDGVAAATDTLDMVSTEEGTGTLDSATAGAAAAGAVAVGAAVEGGAADGGAAPSGGSPAESATIGAAAAGAGAVGVIRGATKDDAPEEPLRFDDVNATMAPAISGEEDTGTVDEGAEEVTPPVVSEPETNLEPTPETSPQGTALGQDTPAAVSPEPAPWDQVSGGPNPLTPVAGTAGAVTAGDATIPRASKQDTKQEDMVPGHLMDVPRSLYLDPMAVPEDGPTPVRHREQAQAQETKTATKKDPPPKSDASKKEEESKKGETSKKEPEKGKPDDGSKKDEKPKEESKPESEPPKTDKDKQEGDR
jgi:TolA-binding protein